VTALRSAAGDGVDVAELYWGTTSAFVAHTKQNEIAGRLKQACFEYYGWNPPESEVRSWRNSLKALSNAIELGGLDDHGLLLEYQLPLTSKRLDAMITGHDRQGRSAAVIVEFKQWSEDVAPSRVEDMVTVRYGSGRRETLHPSAQVGQYRQYLADAHETFHEGSVDLRACSYLHDFTHDDQSELLSPRHANVLGLYPLFAGDRVTELVGFLDDHLGDGRGIGVLRGVREGRYRPHKKLLDHTAAMIRGEPSYVLLDEQQVVFKSILAKVAELAANGSAVHHATGSAAFTNTVRKRVGTRAAGMFKFFNSYLNAEDDTLDVLVCDEAQELTDEQQEALLPTISSAPTGNPQFLLTGTPPAPESGADVFRRTRTAAIEDSSAGRLAWHEWSVDDEYGAEKFDADDQRVWAATNPALGGRLNPEVI